MYVWYNNGTKASIAYPSPYGYQNNPVMILAGKNDEKLAISVRCAKK